jgi:hypothetical protein
MQPLSRFPGVPLKTAIVPFCPTATLAIAVALLGITSAQDDTRTLSRLKAEFNKESGEAVAPQLERYIRELQKLEQKAGESRDYKLAILIRDERMAATADWERSSARKRERAVLLAASASTMGGVTWKASSGTLENWSEKTAKVSWALPPGITTGAYMISLEYANPGSEVAIELRGGSHSVVRTLPKTDGASIDAHVVTGLRLSDADSTLSLSPEGSGAAKFQLRSVTLTKLQFPKPGKG